MSFVKCVNERTNQWLLGKINIWTREKGIEITGRRETHVIKLSERKMALQTKNAEHLETS